MAYPGAFTYKDLVRLSKRDFEFWYEKATKSYIQQELRMINTFRIAQAENQQYRNIVTGKYMQIRILEDPDTIEDQRAENWQVFQDQKKGGEKDN